MYQETLCWSCRRSVRSGCPWFAEHRPVPGWTAERRDVAASRRAERNMEESYLVISCPLHMPDRGSEKREKWTGPYYEAPLCRVCYSRRICMERHGTCSERAKC